jgi:hypothetical protein
MKEIEFYFGILELQIDASEEEIKQAYRDLVNVWHPDRFAKNSRLQEKANEKLKEINLAYEKVMKYIAESYGLKREEKVEPPTPKESGISSEWIRTASEFHEKGWDLMESGKFEEALDCLN